ncbi:DUF3224 domain-containing protein [Chromobacterium alticapitis]|uniref:DUF3224 domain-containing protein n=1 Tax=Chromobacterium alticapitis TaxID=2073169 RepID=A0A2S5DJD9_9NEIS|nr:DUF3224 domain-containing protein [Chromobacterium alticapitis]POZ63183.1 hypothetical protein C2I19_05085 [Chromobacterium alticapitis]
MGNHTAVSLASAFLTKQWQEQLMQQTEGGCELKRASIVNELSGPLQGEGRLEYQLMYPVEPGDDVVFMGFEQVVASWGDLQGSFVLRHDGVYSQVSGANGTLTVVPGSGSGGFAGIRGEGQLIAKAGEHGGEYRLTLKLS